LQQSAELDGIGGYASQFNKAKTPSNFFGVGSNPAWAASGPSPFVIA